MVRTVEDAAITMNAIAGHDPKDQATTSRDIPDYTAALTGSVEGLRIGVVKEYFDAPLDSEVESAVRGAISQLAEMGATVTEVSLPLFRESQAISGTILMSEAAAYHRDLLARDGDKLTPSVRLRLEAGLFVTAADYLKAQQGRARFNHEMAQVLREVDLLAGPTEPVTAPPILATEIVIGDQTVGVTGALTQYTRPYNISGTPAITVPCGFSESGMPIALQLAGRPFDEATVLRAAHAYEQASEWRLRRPPI
jgi:aspartyl-tRNA(Asn)/glutamyl-tRNA(Gln) amidotransferase subunit A